MSRLAPPGVAIVALTLSACGQAPVVSIEGPYLAYVQSFTEEARVSGVKIEITELVVRSAPLERGQGECAIEPDTPPTVTIDPDYWKKATEAEREQTVYHELGHCILRRAHTPEVDSTGRPVSMMHPNRIHGGVYLDHRDEYLDELFERKAEF